MTPPFEDPESTKYPDRTFFRGRWRTPVQIETFKKVEQDYNASEKGGARFRKYRGTEKGREVNARANSCRVFGASGYLGYAPTPEAAADLTNLGREFRDRQKQSRA